MFSKRLRRKDIDCAFQRLQLVVRELYSNRLLEFGNVPQPGFREYLKTNRLLNISQKVKKKTLTIDGTSMFD